MKCKYTNEEKQKILDRYISGDEATAGILAEPAFPKAHFTVG